MSGIGTGASPDETPAIPPTSDGTGIEVSRPTQRTSMTPSCTHFSASFLARLGGAVWLVVGIPDGMPGAAGRWLAG